MNKGMTAGRLKIVLISVIVIMTLASASGFWVAQKQLRAYATEISRLNADAQSGDSSIQTLKNLEIELDQRQKMITDAHSLVADSATYADLAVQDITRIANETGVSITGFEFTDVGAASGATNGATTPPAAGAAPATPQATPTGGVSKKTISVAVDSPIKYDNLMRFIERIESNPLKLDFASISLTKGEGDLVDTQSFTIGVYVR